MTDEGQADLTVVEVREGVVLGQRRAAERDGLELLEQIDPHVGSDEHPRVERAGRRSDDLDLLAVAAVVGQHPLGEIQVEVRGVRGPQRAR